MGGQTGNQLGLIDVAVCHSYQPSRSGPIWVARAIFLDVLASELAIFSPNGYEHEFCFQLTHEDRQSAIGATAVNEYR